MYDSSYHSKTYLRYHIIFSTKYRRKCLTEIRDYVLQSFKYVESISDFNIICMEIDKDHIHLLVSFPPKYSIEQIVRRMKQMTTHYLWNVVPLYLRAFYVRWTILIDISFTTSYNELLFG